MSVLRQTRASARTLRGARREAARLYDVLLGDGPAGPPSWIGLQAMIPHYRKEVVPIRRRATVARRELALALQLCRELRIPRWQIRLALV